MQKSIDLIEQVSPRLIVLGKSLFLFPEPLPELAEVCRAKDIPVLYDAAHVFGLIAGGQFQDPWREGATWVTASTHKTFPGPQRGVIVSDLDEEDAAKYWPAADRGVFPGSSSNHHLHTLPALLVAIREMQAARRRLRRADRRATPRRSGAALDDEGVPVEARDFGYTQSHQIAVNVSALRRRRPGRAAPGGQRHHRQLQPAALRHGRAQPLRPAHRRAGDDALRHEASRRCSAWRS